MLTVGYVQPNMSRTKKNFFNKFDPQHFSVRHWLIVEPTEGRTLNMIQANFYHYEVRNKSSDTFMCVNT